MKKPASRSDREWLAVLGARLRQLRLRQNLGQRAVADAAGIGERTLRSLEKGEDAQLSTLIAVLRALGQIDALEVFLPAPLLSPMELLERRGKTRKRASPEKRDGEDG